MSLAIDILRLLGAGAFAALALLCLAIVATACAHDSDGCRRCAALDRLITRVRGY